MEAWGEARTRVKEAAFTGREESVARTVITKVKRVKQEGAEGRIQGTGTLTRKETEGSEHSDRTGKEGKGAFLIPSVCQAQCPAL